MINVIRSSSVDNSQNTVVAEFATRSEAMEYIKDNTVDGVNVSDEVECDYLRVDGDDGKSFTAISISVDGVWAGSGKLRDGIIEDCGAVFAGDQDESENVYELIEEGIEEGKDSIKVELSDRDDAVIISWTITAPS